MFLRQKKIFRRQHEIDDLFASLASIPTFWFPIDRFPKGIDNAHIDVYLSPHFTSATRILVRRMLEYEIGSNCWGERQPPPGRGDLRAFENTYTGMMEAGVTRARKKSAPEQIQLLQFAIIKFLLVVVVDELAQYRDRLQHSRTMDGDQSSGKAVHLHERLVILMKEQSALRYRVVRKLFRHVYKLESTSLRKLRKGVLGRSWPVPKQVLFNPMLQLPSLWADEQFMHHYSLAVLDKDDPERFGRINQVVTGLFKESPPAWAIAPAELGQEQQVDATKKDAAVLRQRHDQGSLTGFLETELLLENSLQHEEYGQGLCSWLDEPDNLDLIFSPERPDRLYSDASSKLLRGLQSEKQWRCFHSMHMSEARKRFRHAGILARIMAAREAPQVFKELHGQVPVALICRFLEGGLSRRKLLRKLSGIQGVAQPEVACRVLDSAATRIRRMSRARQNRHIRRFLRDFATLRRDLKLAYRAHWVMNQLRILVLEEDVALSRSNSSLQEFVQHTERGKAHSRIRNHVIIKADVRGSTAIIKQLHDQNLNPASHFSLNFFQPINQLLNNFGANKVFVEGDAVILSIFEYEDTPYQWFCVCHACGLARKILQVVDAQNARNRKHGLPELELGLGISFNDGSPAFLYDGDQEIMISQAINRADRLSSCSAELRRTGIGEKKARGVEVVVPVEQGVANSDGTDQLMRYNVNGIELDMPAFFKLKSELALRRVGRSVPGYSEHSAFYAGRYPDRTGKMHWLVVREAPVRLWVGNNASTEEEWGRRFYEVVTDPAVVSLLKERVSNKRDDDDDREMKEEYVGDETEPPHYLH